MSAKLQRTSEIIEQGIADGLHLGAQLYISHHGQLLFDDGIGEARAGAAMRSDTINHWLSSGKPITAVAIAQLWERGLLALDDRVARHVPEFAANGKEPITIRHILTHTAGFRGFGVNWDRPVEELLKVIYAMPLEPNWKIGKIAGYHGASSWFILAEIIRRIDGRPIERFVREEIFLPLRINDSWIGMSGGAYREYVQRDRIAAMYDTSKGPPDPTKPIPDERACAAVNPGGNYRAPARELGKFYEMLARAFSPSPGSPGEGRGEHSYDSRRSQSGAALTPTLFQGEGEEILRPQTIEALTARHRTGLLDLTFQHKIDFGLGFVINSNLYGPETVPYNYGPHASPHTFGHSGSQSSCAFCDPENNLVVTWVCNGLAGEAKHQQRQRAINEAIYEDLAIAG